MKEVAHRDFYNVRKVCQMIWFFISNPWFTETIAAKLMDIVMYDMFLNIKNDYKNKKQIILQGHVGYES